MCASTENGGVASPSKRRGRIALRDLAKLACVDVSTVSRALNNDPRVNEQRARHIRNLAQQAGYRPRPLRSKRAQSIGLLLGSTGRDRTDHNDFVSRIAWHAQQLLAERNLHVNLEFVSRGSQTLPAIVQQNRVDGVLVAGHPEAELVAEIRSLDVPAVAINDSVERLGISCVRSNPEPAIRDAIVQLAARGHEAFGMLLTRLEYPTSQARHRAYLQALAEIGLEADPAWVVTGVPAEIVGGREGAIRLRDLDRRPTAIFCENDWVALGASIELQNQGLQVPRDVSIVGHDDLWVCDQLDPPLTSIRRAERDLIQKAVDLLLAEIEDRTREPREVLVAGEVVWRESTGMGPRRAGEAAAKSN